jgi:hypothetical protein
MSSKGSGTQGYRYYMSLLSGLSRGPLNELVQIRIGDESAWDGNADGSSLQQISAPELFGGDDKEGGIEGPFQVFMGAPDQVLPGTESGLPDVRQSIGGLVSQFRGVATVWFDGMVGAMNPYLKEFRVRRSTAGWFGGAAWYPEKALIFLNGETLTVTSNRAIDIPVVEASDGTSTLTFNREPRDGDEIVINGERVTFVDEDPVQGQLTTGGSAIDGASALAYYVNSRSTTFKAIAYVDGPSVAFVPDKAGQSIHAMNPAHIVYECFTNPEWGRGMTLDDIDENSFIYSANLFCAEKFGLCIIWYRKEDIDVFIQRVCNLVGAVTYTDRETGKMVFRPVRDDYVVADLPLFTPETGLLSIDADDSASSEDAYNEIIGTSVDPVSNLKIQVRAQNLAAYQSQGSPASMDQDYKGIPTKSLLGRVVLRDLRAMGLGLKKYNITLDRRGWRVAPGSVIRISHPGRGISNLVLRVGDIDDGDMIDGKIALKTTIDVYGLPATSYVGTVRSGWVAPSKVAVAAGDERLVEASYRDLYRRVGAANAETADPTSAYIGQLAIQPNSTSLEYDLATKADGDTDYTVKGRGPFTGNAYLGASVTALATLWPLTTLTMFAEYNIGQALLVDNELVRLDALDLIAQTATVTRGVCDTVPAPHLKNAVVWTIDDDLVSDNTVYVQGEEVLSKVLTRTASQVLPIEQADEQVITLISRHARPYPPANVKVNGNAIFGLAGVQANPVITWAERNRVAQGDALIGYDEGSITPETGQTYTIRVYKNDGTLLRTVNDIVGTTWTYDATMQLADAASTTIRIELESHRNSLASWQRYRFNVILA